MPPIIEYSRKNNHRNESEPGTSISSFLSSVRLSSVVEVLERDYYVPELPRYRYPVLLMLKLRVIKSFRKLSYARTIRYLTREDCINLGVSSDETGFLLPHPATLHHFVK